MPGWVKALLIVAIVIVLLVLGCIGVGIYFWEKNKGALFASAEEGKTFGKTTDNKGCVDEAIARYKKDPGLGTLMTDSIFETSCLQTSRATPGFCEAVPKQLEISKSAEWRIEQCRAINLEKDSYCQQLFAPVQQFCEHKPVKSSENTNTNSY